MLITIQEAVKRLADGKLVAIPTETVYGLAADARNAKAIQKVFETKGRPAKNPLIVHLPNTEALSLWATKIPESAYQCAQHFWPGPLTLILPKHPSVFPSITAQQDTIACRVPNHPLTLKLLANLNRALVAPSANPYGYLSPTTAEHVEQCFGDEVPVVDGGACSVGIESTILSLIDKPTILRQGMISAQQLSDILGLPVTTATHSDLLTPGSDLHHYAPHKPLYLVDTKDLSQQVSRLKKNKSVSVLCYQSTSIENCIKMPIDPREYAKTLYEKLHQLDASPTDCIIVESPPLEDPWLAIVDRLQRASAPLP